MYNLCTYCTNKNRCKDAVKTQMNVCSDYDAMDTVSPSMMKSLEKQNVFPYSEIDDCDDIL